MRGGLLIAAATDGAAAARAKEEGGRAADASCAALADAEAELARALLTPVLRRLDVGRDTADLRAAAALADALGA